MRNIKITNREKNLFLILLGIVFVAVSYYFGYQTLKEETENLKKQNSALESQIEALENIEASKEQYVADTDEMQKTMVDIIEKFPADMISEDAILYMKNLEQMTGSYVNTVTIPGKEYVEINAPQEADILKSIDDVTGVVAAYGYVNDGSIPDTDNMFLGKVESEVSYSVTYDGLKDIIEDIVEHEARKNIDNVSLVFNENTGNLAGSMTINYFTLSGTGKEYNQPTVTGLAHGIDCIFGELSGNVVAEEVEE
ncbi:MAG: hypothetical protein IKW30_03295 [Lachnospiraceae bacterium]|nr:hypothetical protein [Lachnospiraceae bacterium]